MSRIKCFKYISKLIDQKLTGQKHKIFRESLQTICHLRSGARKPNKYVYICIFLTTLCDFITKKQITQKFLMVPSKGLFHLLQRQARLCRYFNSSFQYSQDQKHIGPKIIDTVKDALGSEWHHSCKSRARLYIEGSSFDSLPKSTSAYYIQRWNTDFVYTWLAFT